MNRSVESTDTISGGDLAAWCRRVRRATGEHSEHLDAINVLFDEDWDTGTNLRRLWASADETTFASRPVALAPAEVFALWGQVDYTVVGRSTRILKQAFRAMAAAAEGMSALDPRAFATVLAAAAELDWRPLLFDPGPQPGTVLDVITAAADAADATRRGSLDAQLHAVDAAAQRAVNATPTHHAVLRRIGVVDAGALGLGIAFRELVPTVTGRRP